MPLAMVHGIESIVTCIVTSYSILLNRESSIVQALLELFGEGGARLL